MQKILFASDLTVVNLSFIIGCLTFLFINDADSEHKNKFVEKIDTLKERLQKNKK